MRKLILFLIFVSVLAPQVRSELKNGMSADIVIGQDNFSSSTSGLGPNRFNFPGAPNPGIFSDGTRLLVTDYANNRVLMWNEIPKENNPPADVVIGQADFFSNAANQGGAVMANTLDRPSGVAIANGKLIISDRFNRRTIIFNSIPMTNNASADVAVGEANLATSAGGTTVNRFSQGANVFSDGKVLIVSDFSNQRVLIFNSVPTVSGANADVVIGQPDFTSNAANQGGAPAANTLSNSQSSFFDGKRLYLADTANNRVLIFNQLPTKNNASADVVLGQPDFSTNTVNTGGVSARSLSGPPSLWSDGERLFVSDRDNSRVLVWNRIPTQNHMPADFVIGQNNFTSNLANKGESPSASSLSAPRGITSDGTRLYVKDGNNQRVLIYNLTGSGIDSLGPQFSQGKAVIGKVFWDWDGDGRQDGGIS